MNPILKKILAIITGLVFGSIVNMGIIMISGAIIPMGWLGGKLANRKK